MTEERARLIGQYKDGPRVFRQALEGIIEKELDARPAASEWTAREVVHHLADSEMMAAIRLRLLIGEDEPTIFGYDEQMLAQRLFYRERSTEASLDVVSATRQSTAEILDHLSDEEWSRTGHHTESGSYGVETWLEIYAAHAHDHADQVQRCRQEARGAD